MYTRETAGAKRASDGAALLDVLAQLDAVARVPELRERRALDGADLLLRLAADLADLAPRPRLAVVEAEAQAEHVALRGLEVRVHGVVDGVAELVERRRLLRRGLVALDDLVERRRLREIRDVGPLASPRRTEGHVQREGRQSRAARELQALLRRADARGELRGRRRPPVLVPQLLRRVLALLRELLHVDGHGDDGAPPDRALDGLAHPPRRVRRKAESPVGLEAVHGLGQAERALGDEVVERVGPAVAVHGEARRLR
mmetsp:Transcript_4110/g.13000  ORF Transcript_4110/g.13000 Transcript_4110/m.13000 type:complete len:258 (-) Transcript_4110:541-1314(-)